MLSTKHRLRQQAGESAFSYSVRARQDIGMRQPATFPRTRKQGSLLLMPFE